MTRLLVSLFAALLAAPAGAAVYQCVDDDGRLLLTDSPCPDGYRSNLVVTEPRPASPEESARRHAELERERADAEAAALRDELAAQRAREQAHTERLQALDDKLDALLEGQTQRQDQGLTVIGPPVWGFAPPLPSCGDRGARRGECRPPYARGGSAKGRPDRKADRRPDARVEQGAFQRPARDLRRECGTFGCTPTITHAPGDAARRERLR